MGLLILAIIGINNNESVANCRVEFPKLITGSDILRVIYQCHKFIQICGIFLIT